MSRNDVLEVIECARHYIREQSKKESKEQVEKEQEEYHKIKLEKEKLKLLLEV